MSALAWARGVLTSQLQNDNSVRPPGPRRWLRGCARSSHRGALRGRGVVTLGDRVVCAAKGPVDSNLLVRIGSLASASKRGRAEKLLEFAAELVERRRVLTRLSDVEGRRERCLVGHLLVGMTSGSLSAQPSFGVPYSPWVIGSLHVSGEAKAASERLRRCQEPGLKLPVGENDGHAAVWPGRTRAVKERGRQFRRAIIVGIEDHQDAACRTDP